MPYLNNVDSAVKFVIEFTAGRAMSAWLLVNITWQVVDPLLGVDSFKRTESHVL